MAITVNTKTPIAITVSSVGSGNSPYAKEHNPHRGGGGGHFAPASTGKFMSNERRLKKEIERLRRVMASILNACEDINSPDRKVRKEIAKNVHKALKEGE